jgi:hypothetical protein
VGFLAFRPLEQRQAAGVSCKGKEGKAIDNTVGKHLEAVSNKPYGASKEPGDDFEGKKRRSLW